jgi:uncharacterized protein (DUF1330 family)
MNRFKATLHALGALATVPLTVTVVTAQDKAAGYVVIEFKIKDPDEFKNYSQQAPATIAQYGGKFVVRPGKAESLKGDPPQGPFVVLTFESAEQARKWANSPEYTALVGLRDKAADMRAFIVEGAAR